jgi:hypothetical protein
MARSAFEGGAEIAIYVGDPSGANIETNVRASRKEPQVQRTCHSYWRALHLLGLSFCLLTSDSCFSLFFRRGPIITLCACPLRCGESLFRR